MCYQQQFILTENKLSSVEDRGQTDRVIVNTTDCFYTLPTLIITVTLTLNSQRTTVMTHTYAKINTQGQFVSKDRLETRPTVVPPL